MRTDLRTFEGGPTPHLGVSDHKSRRCNGNCFEESVLLPLLSLKRNLRLSFKLLAGTSNLISDLLTHLRMSPDDYVTTLHTTQAVHQILQYLIIHRGLNEQQKVRQRSHICFVFYS